MLHSRVFSRALFFFSESKRNPRTLLNSQPDERHDLVFVRHAESIFNEACEKFRKDHNIPYVWKQLCNHQNFSSDILHNPDFIDCSITESGKIQCLKAQSLMSPVDVDCIIVSPLLRALQTCEIVFKKKNVPVFVEPLLTGPLRSVSDVSGYITLKKVLFPHFNFSATQGQDQLWFLNYLSDEQKNFCQERFMEKGIYSIAQMKKQVVKLLSQKRVQETVPQYWKRVQKMKNMIARYKQSYKKIAIVSHYYSIEYISSMSEHADGTPDCYMDIQNCKPYFSSVKDILSRQHD